MNNQLTQRFTRSGELFIRKNGPTILTAVGVGGFVISNILTAKAATKSADKRKEFGLKLQEIKSREGVEQKEKARELGEVVVKDGFKILRDFAPAITVGSVSIVCVLSGHGLMQRRQASLVAAYAALDRAFKAYRARVIEEVGAEREEQLYRHVELLPCEEGETPQINHLFPLASPYARVFDEMNPNYTKTAEYNLFFLHMQQTWANDRLRARGFLYLNEVYDALGMRWSQAGQYVGWKLNNGGDNFVDFGLDDVKDDVTRAFINGTEACVLVDFNVDGPINI